MNLGTKRIRLHFGTKQAMLLRQEWDILSKNAKGKSCKQELASSK